jgi:anti-sigma factor RsiW
MSDALPDECAAMLSRISAYLDGELAVTECADIEAHCAGCASCGAVVDSLRRTIGLCRDVGSRSLPDAVRARAREHVRRLLHPDHPEAPAAKIRH